MNAGLWIMNALDIDFLQIENWLQTDFFKQHNRKYTLEQTILSMLANKSAHGAEHFPKPYDVDIYKQPQESVCKHYVGKIRHAYELEGVSYLLKNFFMT